MTAQSKINIEKNTDPATPDLLIEGMCFLAGHFGWNPEELEKEYDIYGSVPHSICTARVGGHLVGTVWLYEKFGRVGQEHFKVLGIGGVCIHKKYRGQGIAKELLEMGLASELAKSSDFALLTTELDETGGLYEKVGFVELKGGYYYTTNISNQRNLEKQTMIAQLADVDSFEKVINKEDILEVDGSSF
ncbi:MAG: GNAT family N-acetyltransferase [Candidatus Dojkabacteria bacterium]